MIVHSLDELMAVVFDRAIADKDREFETAVHLDPTIDDKIAVLDGVKALNAVLRPPWRARVRAEFEGLGLRFPLRLTEHPMPTADGGAVPIWHVPG